MITNITGVSTSFKGILLKEVPNKKPEQIRETTPEEDEKRIKEIISLKDPLKPRILSPLGKKLHIDLIIKNTPTGEVPLFFISEMDTATKIKESLVIDLSDTTEKIKQLVVNFIKSYTKPQ